MEMDDDPEYNGFLDNGFMEGGFPSTGVMDFSDDAVISISQQKREKKKSKNKKSGGFETLGLSLPIFRAIKRKGYQVPTPIQRKTLPLILAGHDVVAMARTGSGKTAAFLLPMLEKLRAHTAKAGARAVILSPTRELALQTYKFCHELGRYTDLRTVHLVGGDSMEAQFEELAKNPDILIATPGRLMHHLSEVEGMSLRSVECVVFDEADRLFEMGFAEQLRQILHHMTETRQTLLFSATMPRLLAEFARAGLRDPQLVRLDTDTKVSPDLKMAFFTLRHEERPAALLHLLREVIPAGQQTIVFVSTKHHVEYLNDLLQAEGISPSVVYGSMDQTARKIHIAKFRARKTFLLIVTDVAARGIDIPLLDNVVNYDFPPKPKLFVHRVGRSARAGRMGTAYSFLTPDELPFLLDLHLYFSRPLRPAPTEDNIEAAAKGLKGESHDSNPVLAAVEAALLRGETVYGRFPQASLDLGMERVRELTATNDSIGVLNGVASRAFRLYMKTRPAASAESVMRSKGLSKEGVHPMLRQVVGSTEAAAAAFAEHLKNFRPKQTVLEAEAESARSKNNKFKVDIASEVMRKKREVHSEAIATAQRKAQERASVNDIASYDMEREDNSHSVEKPVPVVAKKRKRKEVAEEENPEKLKQSKSFRDEEFFISSVPQNRNEA